MAINSRSSDTASAPAQPIEAPWRFIPTSLHGLFDHSVGRLLFILPLVAFARHRDTDTWAIWVPVVLGLGGMVASFLTDYELGLIRLMPMRMHLAFDFFSGGLLAVSPWLFHFSDRVYFPHLSFGLVEISLALLTQMHPSQEFMRDLTQESTLPLPN